MNEISIDPYLHLRTVKGFEYGSNGNNISFFLIIPACYDSWIVSYTCIITF